MKIVKLVMEKQKKIALLVIQENITCVVYV